MYVTQRPNDVIALDAKTGRVFWLYRYTQLADVSRCAAARRTAASPSSATRCSWGRSTRIWSRSTRRTASRCGTSPVADDKLAYSITLAPLVVKDKVIVGVGGGEYGIRGFVAAYDREDRQGSCGASTRFPAPGEPGSETWSGEAWEHGGGSVWVTGSYDPALNLTYWGVGNPGPDWNPDQRPGDNLYTDSVVALDADTGKLKWHYQFTPNDGYDYDSVQVPVLADIEVEGHARAR